MSLVCIRGFHARGPPITGNKFLTKGAKWYILRRKGLCQRSHQERGNSFLRENRLFLARVEDHSIIHEYLQPS